MDDKLHNSADGASGNTGRFIAPSFPSDLYWFKVRISFGEDLTMLINKYSIESACGIPDFILSRYLCECLETLIATERRRREWFEDGDEEAITAS